MKPYKKPLLQTWLISAVLLITTAMLLSKASADTESYRLGDLVIENVYTFATPPGALSAGGYLTISNTGETDDTLIGGSTTVADVTEVHEMKMVDDVMKMRHMHDGLTIPAGETVELMPGGLHIMFMQLTESFTEGQTFETSLEFAKAGKVVVNVQIVDRRKQGHNDKHGNHHDAKSNESMDHSHKEHKKEKKHTH
jgi:copper(I)-binding protein